MTSVDGHTQPIKVAFPGMSQCQPRSCLKPPTLGCQDRTIQCPLENIWYLGGETPSQSSNINALQIVGCKSNCNVLNTNEACCKGNYSQPSVCSTDSKPALARACPDAYSYAYSDQARNVVSHCSLTKESLMKVTFCPEKND